jgi:peptide/nickel transport system substrate-binding protein
MDYKYRRILPTILLLILTLVLFGCLASDPDLKPFSETEKEEKITQREIKTSAPLKIDPAILANRTFNEPPMLAAKVKAGELPPVSERLPENPLVVFPLEKIGTYGGTIRRALTSDIAQTQGPVKAFNDNLMGYERPYPPKSIQLNMADSFELSDDGKTAIVRIRKGVKWSDGVPLKVDDILFWYYDMAFNDSARSTPPIPPPYWQVDGKPIKLEKIDDQTLKISSPKPLGRVRRALSHEDIAYPKHILARHHPKYNPDANYKDFRDLTTSAQLVMRPGLPRLSAWVPVEWVPGQRIVYERNPYYWKIDSEGNQLPYADRYTFEIIQDPKVLLLNFINNELDLFGRYFQMDMYPTLRSEEQKGRFNLRISGPISGPTFYLNWDAPNPTLREAFRNKNVRVALSHAINREEIKEIVYYGLFIPSGYSFGPPNPYYSKEAHMKYSAYDPEKSRALLEEAGYRDTNGDGFREFKDGTRFEMNINVTSTQKIGVDVCELVSEHWGAIGIKANLNPMLRELISARWLSGDFDIHHWLQAGHTDPLGQMFMWVISSPNTPYWHRNALREGPDWLHEATRHVERVLTTVDPAKVREYMTGLRDLHTDNIPVIVAGSTYFVWGAHTRLGNVPWTSTHAYVYRGWGRSLYNEQIYIKQ